MTPGSDSGDEAGVTPLGDLHELVRARDASRELVDEEVAMAVLQARESGAAWGEIARVLLDGANTAVLGQDSGPPVAPA